VRVLSHRDAADVHSEQPGDDVDRPCQHRDHGQGEEAAVGLLAHLRGDFLLLQTEDVGIQGAADLPFENLTGVVAFGGSRHGGKS
jgi:hypothetical protein